MQDEIFGPVLPIFRYSDLDQQVIPFIRARPKPLALYLMTEDATVAKNVVERTSSGGLVVNDVMMHLNNPSLPFGGVGDSGMGNYHGKHSFDAFSHAKAVLHRSTMMDVPQRYPPYTDSKQSFLNFVQHPTFVHYADTVLGIATNPQRMLIWAMGAYIVGDYVTSKL
jgi:aldehyde dehydrogenase (NAD+)